MDLFYADRDNDVGYVAVRGLQRTPVSLAAVTRITVSLDDEDATVLDSDQSPNIIEWSEEDEVAWEGYSQPLWVIRLRLGLAELAAGRYQARVTLYAPGWPHGLVVKNGLDVRIDP
jgi:hypothetical protein